MLRRFFLFLLICVATTTVAQQLPYEVYSDRYFTRMDTLGQVSSTFEFIEGSNAIQNEFANRFFFGGFIGNELKEQARENLKDINRAGAYFQVSGGYMQPLSTGEGETGRAFGFSIKNTGIYSYYFADDAFLLYFYGNKRFAGTNAQPAPLSILEQEHTQINFNYAKAGSNNWISGASIGVHAGQYYNRLRLLEADLFTTQDWDSIRFSGEGNMMSSGSRQFMNGFGASLGFFASYAGDPVNIYFSVSDFGFTSWGDLSIYEFDTVVKFSGFDFDDFTAGNIDFNQDSLFENLSERKVQRRAQVLPFIVKAVFSRSITETSSVTAGMVHQYGPASLPLGFAFYSNRVMPNLNLQGGFSYGGTGVGGINLGLNAYLPANLMLSLNTWHIEGFLFPAITRGQSLMLSLERRF